MNDFEVLSRDAAESGEPVEPKRDAETPVESETVRRVRVGLDALTQSNNWFKADIERFADEDAKLKRELRREIAAAQRIVERFQNALDAALNDVAFYRRAAFWFGVSSLLAVVALVAAF